MVLPWVCHVIVGLISAVKKASVSAICMWHSNQCWSRTVHQQWLGGSHPFARVIFLREDLYIYIHRDKWVSCTFAPLTLKLTLILTLTNRNCNPNPTNATNPVAYYPLKDVATYLSRSRSRTLLNPTIWRCMVSMGGWKLCGVKVQESEDKLHSEGEGSSLYDVRWKFFCYCNMCTILIHCPVRNLNCCPWDTVW